MWTTKDRFSTKECPAPPGHILLTVSGNHMGFKVKDHYVPAHFLTPANPTKKDQVVLVLKGDWAGWFCKVIQWLRNEKKAVISLISREGLHLAMKQWYLKLQIDICLVILTYTVTCHR